MYMYFHPEVFFCASTASLDNGCFIGIVSVQDGSEKMNIDTTRSSVWSGDSAEKMMWSWHDQLYLFWGL